MGNFAKAVKYVNEKVGPDTFPDWQVRSARVDYPHIPTGALVFDVQTGIGGFPRGMLVELFGPESCGKTTLALESGRECQQEAKQAVLYLDYAHDFDPRYAVKLGVNLDSDWFALTQPATGEDGLRIAEALMDKSGGELGMVIVDDVASMNPAQDVEKEIGESVIGSQARMMSTAIRQLRDKVKRTQTVWVFINQMRDVVDISGWKPPQGRNQPKKTTTPGGRALKFYAGMRIEFSPQVILRRKEENVMSDYEQQKMIGQKSRFTIVKNKCFRPYTSGELYQRPGEGYDSITSCIEIMERMGNGVRKTDKGSVFHLAAPWCSDELAEQTFHGMEEIVGHFKQQPEKTARMAEFVTKVLQDSLEIV